MKLTSEQKTIIVTRMLDYVAQMDTSGTGQTYSRNKMAKDSGVNVAYIDAMVSGLPTGQFVFGASNTVIKDQYFLKIARMIGYELENKYWRRFDTEQYLIIENAFVFCKSGAAVRTVIGATGTGKTYSANAVRDKYAAGTFVVTCANDLNMRDLVRHIAVEMGVAVISGMSASVIRREIERKVKFLYMNDIKPTIIVDEAENLKLPAWGRLKALYDNLLGECAWVVMGTPNWWRGLKEMADTGRGIAPQIFSRFMSGNKTVFLPDVSASDVADICEETGIKNSYVVNRICKNMSNYRDVNDTLVSLQRAAETGGCEIDMELYKREFSDVL